MHPKLSSFPFALTDTQVQNMDRIAGIGASGLDDPQYNGRFAWASDRDKWAYDLGRRERAYVMSQRKAA